MARARAEYEITAKDKTGKAFESVTKGFGKVGKALGGFKAALAGVVGAAGFGAFINQSINSADQIGKLSTRLGASTEALSELRLVASRGGVSFQTLTTGIQRMTRRISEAETGTGVAVKALKELQVPLSSIKDLAPDKQFEVLADALNAVENPAKRVRLAMALFDTEGVSLLQVMKEGASGIKQVRDEAKEMGLSLDSEATKKIEAAKDAFGDLTLAFKGFGESLAGEFAPGIGAAAKALTGFLTPALNALLKQIKGNDMDSVVERLRQAQGLPSAAASIAANGLSAATISGSLGPSGRVISSKVEGLSQAGAQAVSAAGVPKDFVPSGQARQIELLELINDSINNIPAGAALAG